VWSIVGFGRRVDPLQQVFRDLVQKARSQSIAELAVQHPALRQAEIKPAPGTRDGDIHQAPFFLNAVGFVAGVVVGKQPLLQSAQEHGVELQPLGACTVISWSASLPSPA